MPNRSLLEEIDFVANLSNLVTAYEEIAVMRIQRARSSVISNRLFMGEMKKVMADVRLSYRRAFFLKKKHTKTAVKNKKPLAVLISADNRLSGSLVMEIYRNFYIYTKQNDCDVLIVGKVGAQLYSASSPQAQFTQFDFPDRMLDSALLSKIFAFVDKYGDVRVFYGKMASLLRQDAIQERLGVTAEPQDVKKNRGVVPFIFEPTLEEVSIFFDTEILASLISQSVHEGQLAIWGSRVKAMEETTQRIEKQTAVLMRMESVERHAEMAKKQRQTIAGRELWGG